MNRAIKVISIQGRNPGEVVSMEESMARTFCSNGQAEPHGWDPNEEKKERGRKEERKEENDSPATDQPLNRMMDTRKSRKS